MSRAGAGLVSIDDAEDVDLGVIIGARAWRTHDGWRLVEAEPHCFLLVHPPTGETLDAWRSDAVEVSADGATELVIVYDVIDGALTKIVRWRRANGAEEEHRRVVVLAGLTPAP